MEKPVSQIRVVARLKIKGGKLENFKQVAQDCLACSRSKDRGTLQYDLYLSADESEAVLHELYVDSQAMIDHIDNLGELIQALGDTVDISVELYGEPTPALIEVLGGEGVPTYRFVGGL